MTVANLSFRDLRYIVAVADCGSVSRAAEACSITQPALSERLKRIEGVLGVELFERSKRATRTTYIGDRIVTQARHLLEQASGVDEIIQRSRTPLSGPLHIGVIATLGPYLMPFVIPELRARYAELEIILHEGLTDKLLESLQAASLDIVIAAAPLRATGIDSLDVFYEEFVLAVPRGHRLSAKKRVSASDLCGDEMVLLKDGHCLSGQALDVCPARQRQNRRRLHAMSMETLRHMVAAGAGYSLLPSLSVGRSPPLSDLVHYRELDGSRMYGRQIVIAWRKSSRRKADAELIAETIRQSLPTQEKR